MPSPNQKPGADPIRAPPQKSENRRYYDRGDVPVETIEQPAMPGNDVAGVVYPPTALHRGFKEIAELGTNREHRAQQQQRAGFADTECREAASDDEARYKPADR